jgi:hypothetical protein
MVRNLFFFLAITLVPAFAAADTTFEEIDICLGSTATIQADEGAVFWYTEPKFGNGWPNMAAEGEIANVVAEIKDGDAFVPVNYVIHPNASAFEDMTLDKASPAWNPVKYTALVRSRPSHIAIQGRAMGERLVVLWESKPSTGVISTHYIKVNTRQCGVTTTIPVNNIAQMCEGAATLAPEGANLKSDDESVIVFKGSSTGLNAIGAVSEGRARITTTGRRSGGAAFIAEVRPEGTFPCPSADAASIEPIEGDNDYALELCRGEFWIAPADAGVSHLTTNGFQVWAERSEDGRAFGLMGQIEGVSEVTVAYADGNQMRLEVNVVTCD